MDKRCTTCEKDSQQPGTSEVLAENAGNADVTFAVKGLDCADCAANLEKNIKKCGGVVYANLNFAAARLKVAYDSAKVSPKEMMKIIQRLGYEAEIITKLVVPQKENKPWFKQTKQRMMLVSGGALLVSLLLEGLGISGFGVTLLYAAAAVCGGWNAARAGWYSLKNFVLDMNVLMTVAVLGAFLIGETSEGATVAFLFAVGNALQSFTMDKTRQSIRNLMELAPPDALVRRNGIEERLAVEEIRIGDILVTKPGERIAMDGVVASGFSRVNEAAVTGEPFPANKAVGDVVYAGTVNGNGALEIRVTKVAQDSTLMKIMELVEKAQASKAPAQQFVEVFAKYYTPAVIVLAAAVMVFPPALWQQPFSVWFYKGLVLLVIACPCALVISTPVSIVAAIGNASRQGVLIKGGAYLEQMGMLKAIVFDKTGTLTLGQPEVTEVFPFGDMSSDSLLALAAGVEKASEHPLAKAVLAKCGVAASPGKNFEALPGKGAKADIEGKTVYVGNAQLFIELGHAQETMSISVRWEERGETVMFVGTTEGIYGAIAVADTPRPNAKEALLSLRRAGIRHLAMLTGDNARVAKTIAGQVGVDSYSGQLLPEDKVCEVKNLLVEYGSVAMVGDGINDAPALAAASVGIAMGFGGTDAALETADIVLMADDLDKLPYVVELGRKTVAVIKQNIVFAIAIKVIILALTFINVTSLWLAVVADTGAACLVTLNGMRLLGGLKDKK
ncbi:MAG: kdpB 1 [Firmicutes bacterium]|nr:kdpB 1 [Bacillota bacterium]